MIRDIIHQRNYNPYSSIWQAVVLQGTTGRMYSGVRIENLSFPLTIDAVAVAFSSCLSEGDSPYRLYTAEKPDRLAESWCNEFEITCIGEDLPAGELFDPAVPFGSIEPFALLRQIIDRAHVPNSGFKVAAVAETATGYITGVNIETQNWANGLCAERTAIGKAIATGHTGFKAIHVYAPNADFISPCGACRQVLIEHMPHHPVILYHNEREFSEYFTDHLLPYHFNSAWLKNRKKN